MKQTQFMKKSIGKATRAFLALAGVLAVPACMVAQTLPTTPPSGYDTSGRFPAGTVQWNVSYYSSVAGSNLNMHVYTPPGYTPSQKYGVVYCYQGISVDAGSTFYDWCVYAAVVCDNLIGEGKISKGVIIVALDDQFAGTYSNVRDMTIRDAIPYVDSQYSTYADADHRGVYGYSWGGGWAFNVGCENLDSFRFVSPSSAAPSKDADTTLFPNGGAEAKQKMKCLFISCGDADWMGLYSKSLDAHNYCVANGIPHYWWSVAGGNHDAGSVWRPAMWNFLQLADRAGISSGGTTSTGGACKLLARHSGKAMEAAGFGTANGTQIQQWTYVGGASQQWMINSLGGGLYSIVGVQSGKCVDISNWGTTNGSKVQLWDYVGGSNQKYSFTATTNGFFRITPSHATGSCLDVSGVSTSDGAVVHLWTYGGGQNQQWQVQPVDGTVKLTARHSSKAMDAYGAQTANGTQIQQWTYGGGANQKWTVTDTGSGNYKIIGVQSGKAVDISNGGTANGTKVQLWDYYANSAQLYKFTATEPGYFRITPNCATGSCLDVSGISTADGAVVQLWQWLGGSNQQWATQAP
jgi:enterochelin esterase family protein